MQSLRTSARHIAFLVSATIPLLATLFLSEGILLYAIVVFGQAHFLITYIYIHRARKIGEAFLLKFFVLAAILTPICYLALREPMVLKLLILTTSLMFIVHYLNDELRIGGTTPFPHRWAALLSATAAFAGLFAAKTFVLPAVISGTLIGIAMVSLAFFLFHALRTKSLWQGTVLFLLGNITVLSAGTLFLPEVTEMRFLGFIVLFHYLRWYFHYFQHFTGEVRDIYWDFVIWCHAFVTICFALFIIAPATGIAYLFFAPPFFFGWTIMHIILTFRLADYRLS